MDYAPTLLGLLNWTYPSRFFGHDVRKIAPEAAHALLGNYQKLGLRRGNDFMVLKPVRQSVQFVYNPKDYSLTAAPLKEAFRTEAISYYQAASYLYDENLYRELTPEEFNRYLPAPGHAPAAP
jgi:hypothetical protein